MTLSKLAEQGGYRQICGFASTFISDKFVTLHRDFEFKVLFYPLIGVQSNKDVRLRSNESVKDMLEYSGMSGRKAAGRQKPPRPGSGACFF